MLLHTDEGEYTFARGLGDAEPTSTTLFAFEDAGTKFSLRTTAPYSRVRQFFSAQVAVFFDHNTHCIHIDW